VLLSPAVMGAQWVRPVVRLRAGADPAAVAERATLAYIDRPGWPTTGEIRERYRVSLVGLTPAADPARSGDVAVALLLTGVAVLVLLIACTNAASLLLVRAAGRQRELSVRAALGASRSRIARLLVAESTLLAVLAAAVTVAITWRARPLLQRLVLPQLAESAGTPEPRLIVGVLALGLVVGITTALAPIARLRGAQLYGGLRDMRGGGRSDAQQVLVAVQCAVSLVLLAGAGAFATSLRNVERLDLGVARHELVAASVNMAGLGRSRADLDTLHATIVERLEATPGVRAATLATNLPLRISFSAGSLHAGGGDSVAGPVYFYGVQGAYFEVTGTPVVVGRALGPDDDRRGAPPVAVVNETLARRLWPSSSPLGRCIRPGAREAECLTVVGVARDVHRRRVREDASLQYYVPAQHMGMPARQILVRTSGPAEHHVEAVRQAILSVEPDLPFVRVGSLSSELESEMRPWRLGTGSFSVFALLAAVLAAVGLYAAVSYALRQRIREIGVRIALGARRATILRLVLRDALRTGLFGCALGLVAALMLAPTVEPLLYDTDARSPWLLGTACLTVLAVSAVAVIGPALRAARTDPSVALRAE
jgi:putative ABC transport system permease protein